VQEEIRFVICPELIVSRLITAELDVRLHHHHLLLNGLLRSDPLQDNEALLVSESFVF
jgi:hypothetical protein